MADEVKIKQVEWFDSRWYKLEVAKGEVRWIPSVTTKLGITDKPFLARWRGDIGNREADMRLFEAQNRGSRIHAAFDVYQKGGVIIYNPWQRPNYTPEELEEIKKKNTLWFVVQYQDEMHDLLKLSKFHEIVKPEIIMTEGTVYSLEDNDAGTVDALYKIQGGSYLVNGSKPLKLESGVYVVDLKTGSVVDKNAYRQTAAYVKCILRMKIANPIGTIILHTQSKNKAGIEGLGVLVHTQEEVAQDLREYRLISDLWMVEHGQDTPRVFEFPSIIQKEITHDAPQARV